MAKKTFSVDIDGRHWKLAVKQPTAKHFEAAQIEENKAFKKALQSGALLSSKLDSVMREQGIWDDEKEREDEEMGKEIAAMRARLKSGGMKLSEGKALAIQIREKEAEREQLRSPFAEYVNRTVEGQARNAYFNTLVALCTVDEESGSTYFRNVDDFLQNSTGEVAVRASNLMLELITGVGDELEQKKAENIFLKTFNFVDEKMRLVDNEGRLCDKDGRLLDENGRYINESGEYVNLWGQRVDEDGELIVESHPFLDEDGKPAYAFGKGPDEEQKGGDDEDDGASQDSHPESPKMAEATT